MQKISSKLLRIQELANNVRQFDFDGRLDFQAGQFLILELEDGVTRSYSIANVPGGDEFSLCVKLVPGGRGTEYLWGLKEGDIVNFSGPTGHFVLSDGDGDLLFVATGVGIAPFMSMFPMLGKRKAKLYFGVRSEEDLFYLDELAGFENLEVVVTLSQPGAGWGGAVGRVTDHLRDLEVSNETNVYVCGNGNMVKDVRKILLDKGVPKDRIHLELFTPIT